MLEERPVAPAAMTVAPRRAIGTAAPVRVLHLIHETSFGGVESAAENLRRTLGSGRSDAGRSDVNRSDAGRDDAGRSGSRSAEAESAAARPAGAPHQYPAVDYRVAALAASPAEIQVVSADVAGSGVNSPRSALRLLAEVRRTRPDVVVTSLWRTVALGPLLRRVSPGTRWAVWVHLPRFTHGLDRLVHRWCMPRADAVLCDSEATRTDLVEPALARSGRTVPVRMLRPAAASLPLEHAPAPVAEDETLRLVFWGRMARQKRLDRAIDLLAELHRRRRGGAELTIIGPGAGELDALRRRAARLGLTCQVRFESPLDRPGLARHAAASHAFVQLSDAEGFAMSAHEALAAGMVCVLTPVGELAADTHDGVDALHHHGDIAETAERLLAVVEDPAGFARISQAAFESGDLEFVDDFVAVCRELSGTAAP